MHPRKIQVVEPSINFWQLFAEGDDSAYEQIYRDNVDALFDYGIKLIGEKNIVEDCIHEMFIELWSKRKSLNISTSIRNYLLISIRRKIFRYIKKSGRHNELHREANRDGFEIYEMDPEESRINIELMVEKDHKLKRAIQTLSRRQHEVISLRFFNDMSYEEISSLMNISPNATYNLVSKAVATLRKAMISAAWLLFLFCSS